MRQNQKREHVRNFIRCYQTLPELWNRECPLYNNREAKGAAYEILTKILKRIDPFANRNSVVAKVDSLRSNFRKEMKQVKAHATANIPYTPRLWYYDDLKFLYEKPSNGSSSKMKQSASEEEGADEESICFIFESDDAEDPLPITPSQSTSTLLTSDSLQPPSKKFKTSLAPSISTKMNDALLGSPSESNGIQNNNVDDEFKFMGIAYAQKLRKMTPMQVIFADRIINEILFEGQMENLTRFTSVVVNRDLSSEFSNGSDNEPLRVDIKEIPGASNNFHSEA